MPLTSLGKLLLVLNQRRVPPQHSYHIPDLFVNQPHSEVIAFLPKLLTISSHNGIYSQEPYVLSLQKARMKQARKK